MTSRRRRWLTPLALLLLLAALPWIVRSPRPTPDPPGAFSFAVLGDAPYNGWQDLQYRVVRREIDRHPLAFVIHVGDIFWRPCTDDMYRKRRAWFEASRHPLVYTPGDNEWTDCWEPTAGSRVPLERLDRIRELFFAHPRRSFGHRTIALDTQGGRSGPDSAYVENARWQHDRLVFATIHLVGSDNAMEPFPGRSAADDSAAVWRTAAAVRWLRETFAAARAESARAVVIAFHANPRFEGAVGAIGRQPFEPFLFALEEEIERFGRPVLVVQGDDHVYTVDQPLVSRSTGTPLPNFTRLQVPGSPWVGWVRVIVKPDAQQPFAFEPHVVPRWRFW